MPIDLQHFGLMEMLRLGNGLRTAVRSADTLEGAARVACDLVYDELVDQEGKRACVLVRCYKTHRLGELPDELRRVAMSGLAAGHRPTPEMPCLTLLASRGIETAWNDRRKSAGHRAIPLATPAMVQQAPMIAALIDAFGLDVTSLLTPTREVVSDLGGKSYGVFHVEHALGSPHIPAQDFVRRYGVDSVIGCGGSLQNGDLFALILFTRVSVSRETADRFRTIALDLKSRFFFFDPATAFDAVPAA